MHPLMIGFFLSCVLLLSGCSPPENDNKAPPATLAESVSPAKVSSKKCCGKDVCTCTNCECCGACENFTSKVKAEKIDMTKVE
jgi:hypothetical protein